MIAAPHDFFFIEITVLVSFRLQICFFFLQLHVMSSFSRPHHHRERILPWAQVRPSRPNIRGGNTLETCGNFFDQKCVEGAEVKIGVEDAKNVHTYVEGCGKKWKDKEGCGRLLNVGE